MHGAAGVISFARAVSVWTKKRLNSQLVGFELRSPVAQWVTAFLTLIQVSHEFDSRKP